MSKEEILELSYQHFGVNERIFRPRYRSDYKHLIRYAMSVYGFPLEEIGDITNTDRSTVYHSIDFVEKVSSVDLTFRNVMTKYLDFLKNH